MLILSFFSKIYETINGWMKSTFKFDEIIKNLYETLIASLPEIVKMIGLVAIIFLLILGIITFIKKFIKTFIVLATIAVIVIVLTIIF